MSKPCTYSTEHFVPTQAQYPLVFKLIPKKNRLCSIFYRKEAKFKNSPTATQQNENKIGYQYVLIMALICRSGTTTGCLANLPNLSRLWLDCQKVMNIHNSHMNIRPLLSQAAHPKSEASNLKGHLKISANGYFNKSSTWCWSAAKGRGKKGSYVAAFKEQWTNLTAVTVIACLGNSRCKISERFTWMHTSQTCNRYPNNVLSGIWVTVNMS